MKELRKYLKKMGACEIPKTFEEAHYEMFTSKGFEFLSTAKIPIETYKQYKDKIKDIYVKDYSGYADKGIFVNSNANIKTSGVNEVHKFLFINSNVKIKAFDYAVLYIVNVGSEIELEKDDTVVVL